MLVDQHSDLVDLLTGEGQTWREHRSKNTPAGNSLRKSGSPLSLQGDLQIFLMNPILVQHDSISVDDICGIFFQQHTFDPNLASYCQRVEINFISEMLNFHNQRKSRTLKFLDIWIYYYILCSS